MEQAVKENPKQFVIVPSLGQTRYFSYMKQVQLVIGNSSSGITESPYLGVPTLNIGDRQKGRYRCENIVQSETGKQDIQKAINKVLSGQYSIKSTYWGGGNASAKIVKVLKCIYINYEVIE